MPALFGRIPVSERCRLDKVGRLCNVGNRFLQQPRLSEARLQRDRRTKGLLKRFSDFSAVKGLCMKAAGNVVQLQWRRHRGETAHVLPEPVPVGMSRHVRYAGM